MTAPSNTTKHAQGRLHRNIRPITRYPVLFAGRNTHVCTVTTSMVPSDVAEANAERLLLCWNSHDALVQALEVIGAQSCGPDWTHEQAFDFIRATAREALAQVRKDAA